MILSQCSNQYSHYCMDHSDLQGWSWESDHFQMLKEKLSSQNHSSLWHKSLPMCLHFHSGPNRWRFHQLQSLVPVSELPRRGLAVRFPTGIPFCAVFSACKAFTHPGFYRGMMFVYRENHFSGLMLRNFPYQPLCLLPFSLEISMNSVGFTQTAG